MNAKLMTENTPDKTFPKSGNNRSGLLPYLSDRAPAKMI
jgi:hypothetical protein